MLTPLLSIPNYGSCCSVRFSQTGKVACETPWALLFSFLLLCSATLVWLLLSHQAHSWLQAYVVFSCQGILPHKHTLFVSLIKCPFLSMVTASENNSPIPWRSALPVSSICLSSPVCLPSAPCQTPGGLHAGRLFCAVQCCVRTTSVPPESSQEASSCSKNREWENPHIPDSSVRSGQPNLYIINKSSAELFKLTT